MLKLHTYLAAGALFFGSMMPAVAQDHRSGNDRNDDRGNASNHSNYYGGMHDRVRQGDYGRSIQQDESRHHHDSGGIGPGKAALIGGAGGAALGAIFGGGLKGSLIGGAAGAGIGAIGGKLAEGNDHNRGDRR